MIYAHIAHAEVHVDSAKKVKNGENECEHVGVVDDFLQRVSDCARELFAVCIC